MGSSTSPPSFRSSRPLFSSSGHELSLRASHLLLTIHAVRCHIAYAKSPAEGRRSGVRSVVGFGQCRLRHRGESTPGQSARVAIEDDDESSYPHSSIQCSRNLIVLLQSWTTTQDLRKPELSNGTLHVPNLALGRCWCFDPL